jgi:hypothetical protein
VTASTLSGNQVTVPISSSDGGGGIYNNGTLTMQNSAIGSNSALTFLGTGGAVFNNSALTMQSSTLSGNSAAYAGGIWNQTGTTFLSQTIIANSSSGHDCGWAGGTVTSVDSLIEGDACGVSSDYNTILGTDPLLGSLADNGGSTETFALLPGSPAIAAVHLNSCLVTDQRGVARPGTACDIGAYESRGFTLTKTGGDNQSTLVNTAFTNSLSVRLNETGGSLLQGGTITFTAIPSGGGASAVLSSPTALTNASGIASVTATANGMTGSYNVTASAPGATSVDFNLMNSDATSPVVTVPADMMVEATGPGGAVVDFVSLVSATDETDPPNPTVTCVPPSGSVFPVGDTTVNCSATDTAGNTGTNSFTITVNPPASSAYNPLTQSIPSGWLTNNPANATRGWRFHVNTAGISVTQLGVIIPPGFESYERWVTLWDMSGNMLAQVQVTGLVGEKWKFVDLPTPVALTQGTDYIVTEWGTGYYYSYTPSNPPWGGDANIAYVDLRYGNDVTKDTYPTSVLSVYMYGIPDIGYTIDPDTTPPVVTVPADMTVEATGPGGAAVDFASLVSATDETDPANPVVTCDPASGSTFPVGDTTVNCSATDTAGNTGTNSFTITVNPFSCIVKTNADSGTGSLREKIAEPTCSTITFDNDYTILLASTLTINTDKTIDGGTNQIIVSGNNVVRVFYVNDGVNFNLQNLTVANGSTYIGGGIYIPGNSVVAVKNSTFSGNNAYVGGGIYNYIGDLTVTDSAFIGNSAAGAGGIYNYYHNTTVTNSTFFDNHGGSIFSEGHLWVTNSTFSANYAEGGGSGVTNLGVAELKNTIIVNSASGNNCDNGGYFTDGGGNLEDGATCGFSAANGSLSNTDPLLGAFGNYGGSTNTFPLLPGSPAIDSGNVATCAAALVSGKDQRGVTRPSACDIGAFESQGFTLTKTGGDNQSTPANADFGAPLTLSVASAFGEPVDGGLVTFTSPDSGASAGITTSPAAISSGAASVDAAANGTAGGYNVTANASGANSVDFALRNIGTPVITWSNPANIGYGTALSATQLNATANITGAFTYTPAADTLLNVGTHTLHVDFVPDDTLNYTDTSKDVSITVTQAAPVITWSNPANIVYGTALSSTQLNATASTAGAFTYTPAAGEILDAGTHTLHVDFVPLDSVNYAGSSKDVSITVTQATPVLTWANPADIVYGTALDGTQLNATANTTGAFTYTPDTGTILDVGTHTLHVEFTPSDASNYTDTSKDVSVIVTASASLVTWSNPANIVYGTALSAIQLNATASVPGSFTYTPDTGEILDAGTHTLHVDFVPADSINYSPASKDVSLIVTQAAPILTWSAPADIVYGTALNGTQLNATADVSGGFTYTPAFGAILNAGTHTLHVDFIPTDAVNYANASKDVSITVTQATSVLTWSNPASISYGTPLSATQLNATANTTGAFTYTPDTGAVLDVGTHTLHVDFVPTDAVNYTNTSKDVSITVMESTAPFVSSITRVDPSPTELDSLRFTVTFSESVTGVDEGDFILTTTGTISGETVINVEGSGDTYTVTVSRGTGGGTLRLDVPASAAITDQAGNSLTTPYESGEAYTILFKIYLPLVREH